MGFRAGFFPSILAVKTARFVVIHKNFVVLVSSPLQKKELRISYKCSIRRQANFFVLVSLVPVNRMPEAISSQVARLLKAEREKRGISLNLLAQKAAMSRQAVAFIEQELRNPTLNTLLRLTAALEVEPEKIIAHARKLAGG